jgi:hypothetical protein
MITVFISNKSINLIKFLKINQSISFILHDLNHKILIYVIEF